MISKNISYNKELNNSWKNKKIHIFHPGLDLIKYEYLKFHLFAILVGFLSLLTFVDPAEKKMA